jgi:hypothetical protein
MQTIEDYLVLQVGFQSQSAQVLAIVLFWQLFSRASYNVQPCRLSKLEHIAYIQLLILL